MANGFADALTEFGQELQTAMSGELYSSVADIKMLAHYTGIDALASILSSKEFWFSNARNTNDIDEIVRASATVEKTLTDFGTTLLRSVPFHQLKLIERFKLNRTALDQETYILSLSDHGRTNESDRVAMWIEYGRDSKGVCIVFRREALLDQRADGKFPAKWAPMAYGTPETFTESVKRLLQQVDGVLQRRKDILQQVPPEPLGLVITACAVIKALGYKHNSFEFEREVRFIQTPPLQFTPYPPDTAFRNVGTASNPRTVFVLPLRNYPEYGVNAALPRLIDHIIVEPSYVQAQRVSEVKQLLESHGLGHIPVRASDSPYRPKKIPASL